MGANRAATVLVVLLLGATAAAFAYTERLKLEPGPIRDPQVDELLSPVCECEHSLARVGFSLREGGRITVGIADADGDVVRTLTRRRHYDRGPVLLVWNGRSEDGRIVPDGTYRPHLRLPSRTPILMPNDIVVDSRPPAVRVTGTTRPVISPDGDGRFDGLTVRYVQDEPAQTILFVDGRRHELRAATRAGGELQWFGRLRARRLPPGRYELTLAGVDLAGNVSEPTAAIPVRIRFIELARDRIEARAGTRFGVRVSTDLRRFRWSLGARRGRAAPGLLRLRAPQEAGRYRLVVGGNGRRDTARVVVRRRN
jgi:hypothetical protein